LEPAGGECILDTMATEVTCSKCGAVFERTTYRNPMTDRDSFECECGKTLESWNSTVTPEFRLIRCPKE
jgi:hypothetical protein